MTLPSYYIVGDRPVKAVATPGGGMDVLAFDWSTGDFTRDMSYLSRITLPDAETDPVSVQEFDAHVARLRERITGVA